MNIILLAASTWMLEAIYITVKNLVSAWRLISWVNGNVRMTDSRFSALSCQEFHAFMRIVLSQAFVFEWVKNNLGAVRNL